MKSIIIAVLLTIFVSAASQAQENKAAAPSKLASEITALNLAWAEAINKGDAKALGQLFADDIIVTSGSGQIRDKAGEIKDAAGPPDPDFSWTSPFITEEVRVRVYKDAAVVTGLAQWGFKYKGQQLNNERRYTHTYIKSNGQWKIVAQQVSTNLFKGSG